MNSLLSLLLFAAFFYFMMRFGCGAHMVHGGHGGHDHEGHSGTGMEEGPTKDPVCGMTVEPGQGYSEHYEGKVLHFCSKQCLDKFDAEPRKWAIVPMFIARFSTRDRAGRMKFCVNAFLRFPFNSPGYKLERIPSDCGIAFNILACPIASYLQQQGGADLCVASWCNLDFALAEMWGGKLERTGTLAEGKDRCDFQFKIVPVPSRGSSISPPKERS